MNGTSPEIKNHSTNELPFIRPTTPPARPKNSMITIRPMPDMGRPSPDERLDCPEHGDHRGDHYGRPQDRLDDADDDVDRERCRPDQDQSCNRPAQNRRTGT